MNSLKRKLDSSNFDDRKTLRKMRKKTYETSVEAKKLWEDLRQAKLDEKKRSEVSLTMFNLIVGKSSTLVYAHDTSRVVQTFIKFGSPGHINTIFEELKDQIIHMMKSKFGKHVIRKFLKHGSKEQKLAIFDNLKGNVVSLMKNKEAQEIIEYVYNDFANTSQRFSMEEEYFGPSYALNKKESTKNLFEFLAEFPDKKTSLVDFMKEKLTSLVGKNIVQLSFVHKLLHDFFVVADQHSRDEMIGNLREDLVHLAHTRNGSRVAMKCLWFGTSKDRKLIVKGFKTFVVKICKEEFGHFVLLALFDCVDDTKLVQKALLDELIKSLEEVVNDQYGRKVLFYLLSPRNPMFFHPDVINILSVGDNNEHSKKDKAIRHQELLSYISHPIVDWVTSNAKHFTTDNSLLLLLQAILTNVTSDPSKGMKAVAELVAEPFFNSSNRGFHFIDDTSGHLVLRKLIEGDVTRKKNDETVLFSKILLEVVPVEDIKSWIQCNRGCFIVVKLLELNDDSTTEKIKSCLSNCKSTLKKLDSAGARILLKKL